VRALTFLALLAPASAWAHAADAGVAAEWWLGLAQLLVLVLYVRGASALWRAAEGHRQVLLRRVLMFAAGWMLLTFALLPPFADLTAESFSLHMVQHEILMVAAAPLLVLGAPLALWTWALPPTWRQLVGRPFQRGLVRDAWRVVSDPLAASFIHGLAIWVWHAPQLFERAQASFAMHTLQHAAFLFTAILFWWSILRPKPRAHGAIGVAVLCLFATMLHTGALGVLLTFAQTLWYPASAAELPSLGLTPLEDQQLGGLIMWIPGGFVYVAAALAMGVRWFADEPGATRRPAGEARS
jgi:putative membrane protein